MSSINARILLVAGLASLALVPTAAHAQPIGDGSSAGQSCYDMGRTIGDGTRETWVNRYGRGSVTCTDGVICVSQGTKQSDGSLYWTYTCYDAPAPSDPDVHVTPVVIARGRAAQALAAKRR